MSKLGNVVKMYIDKKTVCNELVKKPNAIQTFDTINLVEKVEYITKNWRDWKGNT